MKAAEGCMCCKFQTSGDYRLTAAVALRAAGTMVGRGADMLLPHIQQRDVPVKKPIINPNMEAKCQGA